MKIILEHLECLSVEKQVTDFPKHYHETFCISLIHKGVELIDFENQRLYGEAGSITITNPYEIHSNPLMDSIAQLQFDTIYISKDLMKYLFNGKNIIFANRKINDSKANQIFIQLKNAINKSDVKIIEPLLFQFTGILASYSEDKNEDYTGLNFDSLNNVNNFIDENITSKFCLEELSKLVNINKYGFAKKFKISTGMSAMNYILMKKIFSSKKLITPQTVLTEIAYDYEFSDPAHYSKTFKRYIGISPKAYQKSLSSSK